MVLMPKDITTKAGGCHEIFLGPAAGPPCCTSTGHDPYRCQPQGSGASQGGHLRPVPAVQPDRPVRGGQPQRFVAISPGALPPKPAHSLLPPLESSRGPVLAPHLRRPAHVQPSV